MISKVIYSAVFALTGIVSLLKADSVESLVFVDCTLADAIDVYEELTGADVVAELKYSYPVNFKSFRELSKEETIKVIEALFELQGLQLKASGEVQRSLVRVSSGQFYPGPDVGIQVRLAKTLEGLNSDQKISHIHLKNENSTSIINLLEMIVGKPILLGPGAHGRGRFNWEASEISVEDTLIALDEQCVQQGLYLVDEGGFIKALVRRPVKRKIPTVEGVGLGYSERSLPIAEPKIIPVN